MKYDVQKTLRTTRLFNRFFSNLILLISGIWWVQATAQSISWSSDKGPYSGAISLLTVDAAGDIFVATNAFGIYRSTDGGGNWQPVNSGLNFLYESVLTSDSLNNIYTGNLFSGLYTSTDKGASWSKTSYIGDVQCAAAISGNRICVGGRQTVSISNDVGKTWSPSDVTTDNRVEVASLAEDNSGNIYAGLVETSPLHPPAPPYGGGIYVSSDSGKTWEYYGMKLTTISAMTISKGDKVFALSGTSIFSAAPKTNIWTEDDAGIQFNGVNILSLLTDAAGEAVAVTNKGIFVYRDALTSWVNVTPEISLASITSGFYNPTGTTFAGTDENGVFCIRSPASPWVQCGIDPRPVTSAWFDSSNDLFAGTEDGVFERSLTAGGWLRVSDGLSHSTVFQLHHSSSDKRLYASTASGLFFLPDKGNYWNILFQQWTYGIAESPDGNKYSGTSGGILREISGTDNWAFVPSIGLPGTNIYSLNLDSLGNIFVGTSLNGVFMSTDGGTFWAQSGISSPLIFYSVKALALADEGRIIAGTDTSGAFLSNDQGANWTSISSIAGRDVACFALDNPSMYFAGTSDRGVFVSTDRGLSWHPANNGLPDSSILSFAIDQNGTLHAGTSKGMYSSTSITNRIDNNHKVPSTFSLLQNYPNPFNPATVITYQLAANRVVTLKVYDVLGRLVNTLIDEHQTAGAHSVTFNGNNLPSGIYFYRLQAGNYVETKKMILLK